MSKIFIGTCLIVVNGLIGAGALNLVARQALLEKRVEVTEHLLSQAIENDLQKEMLICEAFGAIYQSQGFPISDDEIVQACNEVRDEERARWNDVLGTK